MNRLSALALAAGLAAQPALAEMAGATLGLDHSFHTEDNGIAKTTLGGSAAFDFTPQFGVQGDAAVSRLHDHKDNATSAAVHGIFHLTPHTSMGLFYGVDEVKGDNMDFYGFEVGQKSDNFDLEAYVGRAEGSGLTGSLMGLQGTVAMQGGFGVGGRLEHVDIEGLDATRFGVSGEYGLANGLAFTAEVGAVNSDDLGLDGTEPYVGIGARFDLGPNRGATFNRRSILGAVAGY